MILKRINALRLFVQTGDTRPLKSRYIKNNGYLLILRVVMRFSDSLSSGNMLFWLILFSFYIDILSYRYILLFVNDAKIDILTSVFALPSVMNLMVTDVEEELTLWDVSQGCRLKGEPAVPSSKVVHYKGSPRILHFAIFPFNPLSQI